MASRFLDTLGGVNSSNAQNYYFSTPGYCTSQVVTGGAGAVTITVPTGYRAVAMSAGGFLYYVNAFTIATGSGSTVTTGIADMESPAQLMLTQMDSNTLGTLTTGASITSFTLYCPNTTTVFFRWFK